MAHRCVAAPPALEGLAGGEEAALGGGGLRAGAGVLAAWRLCAGCSRLASLDLLSPPCAVGLTVAPASWFGELNAEYRPYLAHMSVTIIIVC